RPMNGTRLLERVSALVARASSSFEEEARTSAVIACRLIREHGLEVSLPGSVREPPQEPVSDEPEVRIIRSKFESSCLGCGGFVGIGERVSWTKGRGVSHLDCC